MAAFMPDEKCLVLLNQNYIKAVKSAAGYHPGPTKPSTADEASIYFLLVLGGDLG